MKKKNKESIKKEVEQIQKDMQKAMEDVFRTHKKALDYLAKR